MGWNGVDFACVFFGEFLIRFSTEYYIPINKHYWIIRNRTGGCVKKGLATNGFEYSLSFDWNQCDNEISYMKFENKEIYEFNRRSLMERLVNVAKQNAILESDYHRHCGLVDKEVLSEEEKALESRIDSATVRTNNLGDFQFAMEEFWEPEHALNVLAHENAHVNKAQSLGVKTHGYKLTFIKREDGKLFIQPTATIDIFGGSNEEKRKTKEILLAPLEYGNRLSDGDIELLKQLEKE